MSTNAILIGMGALDGKELFAIEGPEKLALNSGTTRKSAKTPSHRHMTASENNVQIFKCELRRESEFTVTMKICEILPKAK